MDQYRDFAFVYDELMDDVDYDGWVNYIEQIIKNENAEVKNILELACGTGNIAELDFDVTNLDCVLCACDGFNYITYDEDLMNVFSKTYELLKQEGIFIFDISSFYKLSTVLGDNMYGENRDGVSYMWQNYFDDEQNLVEMELTFFVADEDGKYDKHEERHLQRAYTEEEILDMLEEAGFSDVKVYGDFTFEQPEEDCERVFFVCRK